MTNSCDPSHSCRGSDLLKYVPAACLVNLSHGLRHLLTYARLLWLNTERADYKTIDGSGI